MLMLMVMANTLARAALGVDADRIRKRIVSYLEAKRNKGLKGAMSTDTHKFGFLDHMAIMNDQKSALEMACRRVKKISSII